MKQSFAVRKDSGTFSAMGWTGYILCLAMALIAGSKQGYAWTNGEESSGNTLVNTSVSPEELAYLQEVIEIVGLRWPSAFVMTVEETPSRSVYRAVCPLMAGAVEFAEVTRYESADDALTAYTWDRTFRDLPATGGFSSSYYSSHYQEMRYLVWLGGNRVFRAETQYNGTYCGQAGNPEPIAAAMLEAAQRFFFITPTPTPTASTPTPTPTAPGYVYYQVDPLPCVVYSVTCPVTLTGMGQSLVHTEIYIRGGAEEVHLYNESAGPITIDVPLVPYRSHRLSVSVSWIGNHLWRVYDNLLVWSVPPDPTPTPTPPPQDSDEDGIPDAFEGGKAPLPGQSNMYLPDSDGDGLWDGIEDSNRNGVHLEPGETDPRHRDTDGDGYEDGIEALLLTSNPLDPASPETPFEDADGDALPDFLDPAPGNPDADGDRFLDGYEAVTLGLSAVTNAGDKPPLGDVDRNGVWDNGDSQMILNFFADRPTVPSFDFTRTDLDRNGFIDNADAQQSLNFFGGQLGYLPVKAMVY